MSDNRDETMFQRLPVCLPVTTYVDPQEITYLEPAWAEDNMYLVQYQMFVEVRSGFLHRAALADLIFSQWGSGRMTAWCDSPKTRRSK